MGGGTGADTYRGEKMPKPHLNGLWVINDGHYGYFRGFSEDDVTRQWQREVDDSLFRRAESSERYSEHAAPEHPILCCSLCGALIGDFEAHDRWHGREV